MRYLPLVIATSLVGLSMNAFADISSLQELQELSTNHQMIKAIERGGSTKDAIVKLGRAQGDTPVGAPYKTPQGECLDYAFTTNAGKQAKLYVSFDGNKVAHYGYNTDCATAVSKNYGYTK